MGVKGGSTTIVIQVHPKAKQNKVVRFKDGILHLRIAAPPTKGRANEELIKFLNSILGVTKNQLTIERGMASKKKIVAIGELKEDQVMRLLGKY